MIWVCIVSVSMANAQIKSDTLKEVRILGKQNLSKDLRLNQFTAGQKITTIDSQVLQQYKFQSIADLLSQQTSVFIKSYGFNSLATLNFRGSSAAQSLVIWNGVPLQNAALGLADVSELQLSLINRVNIVYGGSSALFGSGNVGGALMLESESPVFDSGKKLMDIAMGAGSFGQTCFALKTAVVVKKWYLSANISLQNALNNFTYSNQVGVNNKMPNATLQSDAITLNAAYKFDAKNTLNMVGWYQNYSREIPPALFEPASDKNQVDGSVRFVAEWNRHTPKNNWYARSSINRDEINYTDNSVLLHTITNSYQYYQEVGIQAHINSNSQLLIFSPVQILFFDQPVTGYYKQQNKAALAVAYNVKLARDIIDITANAREEVVANNEVFLAGMGAGLNITKWLSFRSNIQNTYRTPSLNELYFFPGGNPNLKPEQGWNEDAGYSCKLKYGHWNIIHDVSVFYRDIHDWILWLGGAVWTPHNIAEVHSRGVETENKVEYILDDWKFKAGLNTAYILATTTASYLPNDGSLSKQIPYTPRYNGQLSLGFAYKKLMINYIQSYTGYRFITSDQSAYLTPYSLGNLQFMYDKCFRMHPFQFTLQCNNIWDIQYQVVAYRPMPGMNWQAGIKISLQRNQ